MLFRSRSALTDPRLLVKHIKDLYASKGTPRAYGLLFRLLFNENITVELPGQYMFRPSDNGWKIPKYIEVTDDPYLQLAVGKSITNTDHSASAIVENIFRIILNSRPINIVYLSHLFGRFKRGDRLECDVIPQWSAQSPIIIGSLTAITVQGSDGGFTTGQVLDVVGSGISGKARVAATVDENGQVQFELTDGGFGYNYDAEVTIKTSIDIFIHSLAGSFIPEIGRAHV